MFWGRCLPRIDPRISGLSIQPARFRDFTLRTGRCNGSVRGISPLNCVKEGPCSSDGWSSGFLKSPASSLPVGPTLYLGPESRFSGRLAQFGRICAMEREIKAGLRRRSSRRVNMMARRNPPRAPRNPSVIERLLKVRRPWPVRRNPVYAITTVQTIARTFTGPHTSAGFSKVISTVPPPVHLQWRD